MYTSTTLEYYSVTKEKEILSFVTIWVDLEVIMLSEVKVTQLCPTLCDPMDYTFHGILQARILEWVAFPFSRGSFQPRIEPRSPALQADSLPAEPQGKPNAKWNKSEEDKYYMISHVESKTNIEKEIRFVVSRCMGEGWGNWVKVIKRYTFQVS